MTTPLTPESEDLLDENRQRRFVMTSGLLRIRLEAIEAAAISRYAEGLVEHFKDLVPDDPEDPCRWCDYMFIGKYDSRDPARHDEDCWWVKARRLLATPEAQEADRG
jgi:hypothetical protein